MADTIAKAKFANVLGRIKSMPKEEGVDTPMSDAQYKKEILSHVNPDSDSENRAHIKSALNHLLKKPGWLAGFTKAVMEEIGTNPTPKNKKYVYGVVVDYIDEIIDLAE